MLSNASALLFALTAMSLTHCDGSVDVDGINRGAGGAGGAGGEAGAAPEPDPCMAFVDKDACCAFTSPNNPSAKICRYFPPSETMLGGCISYTKNCQG